MKEGKANRQKKQNKWKWEAGGIMERMSNSLSEIMEKGRQHLLGEMKEWKMTLLLGV